MTKLAGKRYKQVSDTLTLVGKRCPTREQNRDYVTYLLKVLYLESMVRNLVIAPAHFMLFVIFLENTT